MQYHIMYAITFLIPDHLNNDVGNNCSPNIAPYPNDVGNYIKFINKDYCHTNDLNSSKYLSLGQLKNQKIVEPFTSYEEPLARSFSIHSILANPYHRNPPEIHQSKQYATDIGQACHQMT